MSKDEPNGKQGADYEPPKRLSVETIFDMALPKDITGVIDLSKAKQELPKEPPKKNIEEYRDQVPEKKSSATVYAFFVLVLVLIGGSIIYSGHYEVFFGDTTPQLSSEDSTGVVEQAGSADLAEESTEVSSTDEAPEIVVEQLDASEIAKLEEELEASEPPVDPASVTEANVSSFTTPQLLTLLEPENKSILELTLGELFSRPLSPELKPALNRLADAEDFKVQIKLLRALQKSSFAEAELAEGLYIKLLNDEEYLVRGFAARGLGRVSSKESKAALKKRLEVEDKDIVSKVIKKALAS